MTTTDTPSASPQMYPRPPRSRVPLLLAIVLILIAAGVGAGISYLVLVRQPVQESKQQTHQNLMRMTGLVGYRRDGKHNYYRIECGLVRDLLEQLFSDTGNGHKAFQFGDFSLAYKRK